MSPPDDEGEDQPRQRGRPRAAEVRTTEADRREAIRAKNRRAQAAYRNRQRNQQDDVKSNIEHVRSKREAALAAREAGQAHSRQLHHRVSQAASLLDTLHADPEHAGVSTLPPPPAPSMRFTMESLPLSTLDLSGPAICQSVHQLLMQEATNRGCEVEDLAATTGFDVQSLPGSIRVVEFCNSPYALLDHVFLYIHQGVHIHCLLSRLRDAQALLAGYESEPVDPQHQHSPAPFKRRPDQAQKSVWDLSNRQPPGSTAWLTTEPPQLGDEPLPPRLHCQDLVSHDADTDQPHLEPRPCMCHNLVGMVRVHAHHMQDGAFIGLQRFVARLLDLLGSASRRQHSAHREVLTQLSVDLRLASNVLYNISTEEKDQKCRMCTAMNGDPASLRQEIVRLHTALRANLQELCVVRSMAYILNPSLQFQLSNMAACTQDLTAAEETTLGAEVYQAAALTKPQADKLLTLYQCYKLEVNGLAQKRDVLTSSLCIHSPELEAQLNEEVTRERATRQHAVHHGTAPAGSQGTTQSTGPTAAGSLEAPGTTVSLPRSRRQSTDTGAAAGAGAHSRRRSTGASAPWPPEGLPAAMSRDLDRAGTPQDSEMHRRSSEGAPTMYRRTSAVGTGIDDHSIAQLAQLVSEKSGGGNGGQLGEEIQPKEEEQLVLTASHHPQLEISPLASDLNQLSQLVQPSPGMHSMPFELLPGTSQGVQGSPPPGSKRARPSLGFTTQDPFDAPDPSAGGQPPPKSPRHHQWGTRSTSRRDSVGYQQPDVGEMGLPAAAGPPVAAAEPASADFASGKHVAVAGISSLKEVQRQMAWEEARLLCGLLLDVCSPAQAGVLLTQGFPYTTDLALLLQLLNQEHKRDARD